MQSSPRIASPSTLRRRLAVHIGLMVAGLLLIGIGAIVGVNGLHGDFGVALRGYHQLKQVYDVGLYVATAGDALRAAPPDARKAFAAVQSASVQLEAARYDGDAPPAWSNDADRALCAAKFAEAAALLHRAQDAPASTADLAAARVCIGEVIDVLTRVTVDARRSINAAQLAVDEKRRLTLATIATLSVLVFAGALVLGVRQYRSVVDPLDRLGRGVRAFESGDLTARVALTGDREFTRLAEDFNRMAGELESFYRQLEEKVSQKSRELVRSQRLASVGFLAAGVAHEINNPLGIITGYAERALAHLDRNADAATIAQAKKSLRIICEEAFRCSDITRRLLSLARPGDCITDATRDAAVDDVSLAEILETVVTNLGGLPEFARRRITLECGGSGGGGGDDDRLLVRGRGGDLKQVAMNLILNALEAVPAEGGHVAITANRTQDSRIELTVQDNGSGMSAVTLERVFEPFYTENRGRRLEDDLRRGTGLGLTITQAIVTDHGGTIVAHSAGAGAGSRFVVSLPAMSPPANRTPKHGGAENGAAEHGAALHA